MPITHECLVGMVLAGAALAQAGAVCAQPAQVAPAGAAPAAPSTTVGSTVTQPGAAPAEAAPIAPAQAPSVQSAPTASVQAAPVQAAPGYAQPPPTMPGETPPASDGGRPARTGFQMAFRTGVAFPLGKATQAPGDSLASRYSWQWPLQIDLGAKVTQHVHVGGYFTLAFGAEGDDAAIEQYCDDDDADLENDIGCSAVGFRLGVQGQYHFRPDQTVNPWLGYGLGLEATTQVLQDTPRGYEESTTSSGITYAKLDAGLDFRLPVGLGPYLEVAFGRFTKSSTRINGDSTFSGSIDERAWHAWFTLGVRLVVFP